MSHLHTTLGPRDQKDLGVILPHEHVFVDLRTPDVPGHGEAETDTVVAVMAPELRLAQAAGVTALVECTPIGVGRRVDILLAVSREAGLPLVVPTGVYREPWIPPWVHDASEDDLRRWMLGELTGAIADTGVQAGWIKLSAGDDGLTTAEAKILRAAAAAGRATGAVIGSHTIRGRVVRDQLAIVEAAGYTADRFIWIHTQAEPDEALHLEVARRGAWIEYDALGDSSTPAALWLERILRVLDNGLGNRLLLSHDRGWFDPALPGGGIPRPFTYLCAEFIPAMLRAGIDAETIVQLTQTNPFRAFSR